MGKGQEEGFWGSALETDTGVVFSLPSHSLDRPLQKQAAGEERMHQELSVLTKGPRGKDD